MPQRYMFRGIWCQKGEGSGGSEGYEEHSCYQKGNPSGGSGTKTVAAQGDFPPHPADLVPKG